MLVSWHTWNDVNHVRFQGPTTRKDWVLGKSLELKRCQTDLNAGLWLIWIKKTEQALAIYRYPNYIFLVIELWLNVCKLLGVFWWLTLASGIDEVIVNLFQNVAKFLALPCLQPNTFGIRNGSLYTAISYILYIIYNTVVSKSLTLTMDQWHEMEV